MDVENKLTLSSALYWFNKGNTPGVLIFSYIRRLVSLFWFKILNFNIFEGFRKMNIFGGKKISFWVITKSDYI